MLPNTFQIESAGSDPAGYVHEEAINVMKEIGIDISEQRSKKISDLDEEFINNLDFVITLCAEEGCPVIISKAKKIHWPNPDPVVEGTSSKQQKILFQRVRDNLFLMLKKFFTHHLKDFYSL